MTARLTPRQAEILELIRVHIEATGLPPTRAEICAHFGFVSRNAAQVHLRALARAGVLVLSPLAARGMRLVGQGVLSPEHSLPLVGRVAAGTPILAAENVEDHLRVDPALFRPRADFLLRVAGDSMRDAGIRDGDLVAVQRTPRAEDGWIVVARHGEDAVTIKRVRRAGAQRVQLIAENRDFAPIEIDLRRERLAIDGRVVGVVRRRM